MALSDTILIQTCAFSFLHVCCEELLCVCVCGAGQMVLEIEHRAFYVLGEYYYFLNQGKILIHMSIFQEMGYHLCSLPSLSQTIALSPGMG